MTKMKMIRFDEMRRLLTSIGFKIKTVENAHIFHRSKKDLIVFRRYKDEEKIRSGDVLSTRKLLDMRGILGEDEFDSFFETTTKSA